MKRIGDAFILIGILLLTSSLLGYDTVRKRSLTTISPAYVKVSKPSDSIEVEAICIDNQYRKKLHEMELLLIN